MFIEQEENIVQKGGAEMANTLGVATRIVAAPAVKVWENLMRDKEGDPGILRLEANRFLYDLRQRKQKLIYRARMRFS